MAYMEKLENDLISTRYMECTWCVGVQHVQSYTTFMRNDLKGES